MTTSPATVVSLVSVIIPAYKMGQFIGEALDSVGAQTYPYWEVIVVDDAGPEDGTRAAVKAFAAKHPEHRIDYIRHETNQGVSAVRNTAFSI
jgi:glycosyltransferase involved in cell wall biosynthesis